MKTAIKNTVRIALAIILTTGISTAQQTVRTGTLLAPVQVPLILNGQQAGTATVQKGTVATVVRQVGNHILVNTALGQVWIIDSQIALAPVPPEEPGSPAAQNPPGGSEGRKPQEPANRMAGVNKENPFVNSLGMEFVPVPIADGPANGKQLLFSVWDTRVKDYRVYAEANNPEDERWKNLTFKQGEDHPVVNVSWDDATAFCAWLTEKERNEGKIGQDEQYRLPTNKEWNAAVGNSDYPWDWRPPPKGADNTPLNLDVDVYERTSPVGSFGENQYGLWDMGRNVWQWCKG
jgi:hypothetical protein